MATETAASPAGDSDTLDLSNQGMEKLARYDPVQSELREVATYGPVQ
jgi:hypothetical protein